MNNLPHRTLLILIVLAGAAFWMRSDDRAGAGVEVGCATLAMVWLKGRLIILDFMDLRHAPVLWRWLVQGWLTLVAALVVLSYHLGRSGLTF